MKNLLLIDFSNLLFRSIFGELQSKQIPSVDDSRRIVLQVISKLVKQFNDYTPVLCFDEGRSWRKIIHPWYKANRKTDDPVVLAVREAFGVIRKELYESSPWHIVSVDTCEADDVMYCLSRLSGNHIIVTSDKDMKQAITENVKMYDIAKKMFITYDPNQLTELIVKGDTGDGIPNIKSNLNVLVTEGVRQTVISAKFLKSCQDKNVEDLRLYCEEWSKRFDENVMLVCLDKIDPSLNEQIINAFQSDSSKKSKRMLNWFQYKLNHNLSEVKISI